MKVWELKEGKFYTTKGNNYTTTSNRLMFKTENRILRYYDSVYRQWIRSSLGYNEVLELDFTEKGGQLK